jgi:hypothetical protein
MKIDLHCHSKYSLDNHLEPEILIGRAYELGLDGVCFTEHSSVDASYPVTKIRAPDGFLILRGVEISTDKGHVLAYGLEDDSWNRWGKSYNLDLHRVIDAVHALGGVCAPAHPFRGWESLGDKVFSIGRFDAMETHNGGNPPSSNMEAVEAAMKLGLPSIGGSDCHMENQVGRAFTQLERRVKSIGDIVAEILAGRLRGGILPQG